MSKIKVYELAKELEKPSKELVEFFKEKEIDVKSHMSSVEDTEAEMARKAFLSKAAKGAPGPKAEDVKAGAPRAEGHKGESPKKKNIVHVFRPQNTQSGVKPGQGRRPSGQGGAKPSQQMGRPMQVNNGRPSRAAAAAQAAREQEARVRAAAARAQEMKAQEIKDREMKAQAMKEQTERNEASGRDAAQPRQTVRNEGRPQQGERREQGQGPRADRGDRRDGGRFRGERRGGGDRPQGERRDGGRFQGERRGGDRPSFGDRERRDGGRPQGDRRGGDRPSFGDRERRDGGRPQGERRDGGRFPQGDRNQGRGPRPAGERQDKRSSIPAPITDGQKPQRSKGKGKDDYKKKDFRRDEDGMGKGKKGKSDQKHQLERPQPKEQKQEEKIKSIIIPEALTIQELADKMKIVPSVIVKKLFMQGKIVTVNQEIDYETAEEIALEFDILCEKEEVIDVIEELLREEEEDESKMKKRPPVVCVMGHVDHGKTSLLDAIRNTNVIGREAGGITQHIGASVVEVNGEKITFLDTPGHEAFTAMRMRGASSTDIAILVVAADDGVMPQTVEAINHAKAAGIEIVVAVNKIDKPSANIERVKQELTEYELIAEDWGGSTIFVPVSAKTGEGLGELMEMLLLTAEVMELKANPNRRARGLVLEAELDKGRGSVATVLVQKGTLRVGDSIAAGSAHGKVRAMMDDKGRRVKEAGPSMPVEILGLNDVPNAGEVFVGCANDKEARNFAETFIAQNKVKLLEDTKTKLSLDDLFTQIQEGSLKELGIVVKADVQGSVEAIKQSLLKLSNDEVVVKIIHGGVGAINESDVTLASASNAIIIGFNVRPDVTAKETADREGVDVRLYRVIYNAIEDVEAAMKGMLDPVFEEKVLGHAEVRQTFKASGVGTIAGSYVQDGVFERDCSVRLTRDGIVIFEGPLASLKRFKDDVKEVRAGYECGFVFANFNDIKEGDLVEAFKMVEIPR